MNIDDWLDANRKRQLDTFLASFRQVDAPPNKAARMEKSTKEKSWTRQEYERCYRAMRSDILWEVRLPLAGYSKEIIRAADYSYQARDYDVHGWSNDTRHKRFHNIKWRILTNWEVFPF